MIKTVQEIQETLTGYVLARHAANGGSANTLTLDSNLQREGVLDSFQMIELVEFLEKEFGFSVEMEDVMNGRLESIRAISELILSRSAQ